MLPSIRNQNLDRLAVDRDLADHQAVDVFGCNAGAEYVSDFDGHASFTFRADGANLTARSDLSHWTFRANLAADTLLAAFAARTLRAGVTLRPHRARNTLRARFALSATQTHFALRTNFTARTNIARNALRANFTDRTNRADLAALALRPALTLNTGQSVAPIAADRAFGTSIATYPRLAGRANFSADTLLALRPAFAHGPDNTLRAGLTWNALRPRRTNGTGLTTRANLAAQSRFASVTLWPLWAMEKDGGWLIFQRAYAANKIFQRSHNTL